MSVKLEIKRFVDDYCAGVKDRDLLLKHKISAKELVGIVKKLINEGVISKEAYFERTRKIEELEARQEKDFLKSLYHCPVCSHIHPVPFTTCPSCGTEIAEGDKSERVAQKREAPPEPNSTPAVNPFPAVQDPAAGELPTPGPPPQEIVLPQVLLDKVGMQLENVSLLRRAPDEFRSGTYRLTEVVRDGHRAAVFKAEDETGDEGRPLAVKLFHMDVSVERVDEFLEKVLTYQAGMSDGNILPILGSAAVGGERVLLYPYYSKNFEILAQKHPEGVPLDLFSQLLPQILNAVGYSHMHRSREGVVRRLPHMHLNLNNFLLTDEGDVVKLDGCGVWKSVVETRGYKRHLWEEPGADLSALSPEAFVMDSKFVSPFYADIYALGTVLYRLVTGKQAFSASKTEEYSFAHLRTFPVPPRVHRYTIPGWLDALILRALEKDVAKRWRSATQMELAIGKDLAD